MKAILSMALFLGVCGMAGAADDKVVDPVGTWKCEYEIGGQQRTSTMKIKKDGDHLAGTMSWPDQDEARVKDLKLKDGALTFSAERKLAGMDDGITVEYKLTIDGDKLKGKGAAEFGGEKREWDIEGKREKDDKVGSTSPALQGEATNDDCCFDTSGHKTVFVTVEPDVRLEVLDWGGTGDTMVLLAGGGDNAHVYDQFAHQFTDRFHVIGITRRGYGRSSQPASGYDVNTRARDDVAVLDKLNIRQAVFVGHSLAAFELSELGAAHPDRVKKLVYLDGLDTASGGWAAIPPPPSPPELTAAELESVQRLAAALARDDGYRKPLAAICNMVRTDPSGRIVGAVTPPEIGSKISAGFKPAEYGRIQAPALGIFNRMSLQFRLPYYGSLEPAKQEEFDRSIKSLTPWYHGEIQRFRTEVKDARVVELPDANHYVFIVEEALVVREMRKFLLEK